MTRIVGILLKPALIVIGVAVLIAGQVGNQPVPNPLKLRLVLPNPSVCLGTKTLDMEAVFSNDGDSTISIYKSAIYDFYFVKTVRRRGTWKLEDYDDGKDVGTGDPALHEAPVVVPPHSSAVVPLQYDISTPFFRSAAMYSVTIRYMKMRTRATVKNVFIGRSVSNEVLFEMQHCR